MDVIALSMFATNTDANGDRNQENQFVKMGKQMFNIKPARILALTFLPRFMLNLLDIKTFLDPESFNFFIKLTKHIVKERKENPDKYAGLQDVVQLMMDASVDEKELSQENNYDNLTVNDDHKGELKCVILCGNILARLARGCKRQNRNATLHDT